MLNWIIDFSLRHRLLVIVVAAGARRHRAFSRWRVWTSTPSRTRPRCRFRSTRSPLRSRPKRSNGKSPFRSSRRSAGCRAWTWCVRSRSSACPRWSSRSMMGPTSTSRGSLSTSGWAPWNFPRASSARRWGRSRRALGEVFHYVLTYQGYDFSKLPDGGAGQEAHRVADHSRLGGQAATPLRSRRGRSEQLGRLREAVPGPHRSRPAGQARPDL